MKLSRIIRVLVLVISLLLIMNLGMLLINQGQKVLGGNNNPGSSQIMLLTQPINTIDGSIKNIREGEIQIEVERSGELIPFTISVGPQTRIVRQETVIPYRIKKTNTNPPNAIPAPVDPTIRISDLAKGDRVSVSVQEDLRIVTKASGIYIIKQSNASVVTGQVKKVEGATVTVQGAVSPLHPPAQPGFAQTQSAEYSFTITNNTEISTFIPPADINSPARVIPQTRSDLTVGRSVSLYFTGDPKEVNTALLISLTYIPTPEVPQSPAPARTTISPRVSSPGASLDVPVRPSSE